MKNNFPAVFFVLVIFFASLITGCAKNKKDFSIKKYQEKQSTSINSAKNYDLCVNCIHYTNFSKNISKEENKGECK